MKNGFSIAALAVFLLSGCVSDRPQEAKNAYESDYERFFSECDRQRKNLALRNL